MTVRLGTLKTLAMLLPAGVLGISSALAATPAKPSAPDLKTNDHVTGVADRLGEIRAAVSKIDFKNSSIAVDSDAAALTAEWPNFHFGVGWRNGGWGNGGWRNGGWGNGGWRNGGWGNGGWGNGGGPWHNWHNFWRNW
jgi:rSAM-associated Gly-rich repeat protein